MPTAHVDRFAHEHLPPRAQWPEFRFDLPELQFPEQLNVAAELLDRPVAEGRGDRPCLRGPGIAWSWRELQQRVDRIAWVLVREMGLQPGQRVLLRGANHPMLAAAFLAVVKAGGIAVPTMPLLRAKELAAIVDKARVSHALCERGLLDELQAAAAQQPVLAQVCCYDPLGGAAPDGLEAAMARHDGPFPAVDTAADDCCLFGFTSGTTGVPKATMHFHRDLLAICRCWPPHCLKPTPDDVFIGSPPLAFTFGLGGLLLFPMAAGASSVLLPQASPAQLLQGIVEHGATVLFTAPTSYRVLAAQGEVLRGSRLRKCVSAGEALPAATRALWKAATGLELIDGIGATEMLHIFISHDDTEARPGATGRPVPGYRAEVVDDDGRPMPPGQVGRLRVQGPTGCRYLGDERQRQYVRDGWNYTGDAYLVDADGWFHHQARTDDMIVSAGYNIAGPEVEDALMQHPAVAECGVVGVADEARGQIVKAYVVLRPGHTGDAALVQALQDHVKASIAPYKYPRAVAFVDRLPRTATGKLQRHVLRQQR